MIQEYRKTEGPADPPTWVSSRHKQEDRHLEYLRATDYGEPGLILKDDPDTILTMKAVLVMTGSVGMVLVYMLLAHDAALWRALVGLL